MEADFPHTVCDVSDVAILLSLGLPAAQFIGRQYESRRMKCWNRRITPRDSERD